MKTTITAETIELDTDDDGTVTLAKITIASDMNLSEEYAITTAQYALSSELGCDLETVEALEIEASYMGGHDYQWLIELTTDTEDGE
jgi:hypothetical protein